LRGRAPPSNQTLDGVGKLVLRVAVAALMLLHGVHKLGHGIGGVKSMLAARGLPEVLGYGVFLGEVVAPILMIVGWLTRPAALTLSFTMVVAVLLAHTGDVTRLGKAGQWGIELQALFFASGLAVALLGPGPYSVSRRHARLG
jgi:putative oxidoreductase